MASYQFCSCMRTFSLRTGRNRRRHEPDAVSHHSLGWPVRQASTSTSQSASLRYSGLGNLYLLFPIHPNECNKYYKTRKRFKNLVETINIHKSRLKNTHNLRIIMDNTCYWGCLDRIRFFLRFWIHNCRGISSNSPLPPSLSSVLGRISSCEEGKGISWLQGRYFL